MNYFGRFDAKVSDALGQHPGAHLYSETVHANHVPADAIVVPDAQLLFGAEFKRAGVDLVLSGEGREVVLHDYFKGEHRASLASPDGAHLTGNLVTALSGEVEYAQADGNNADVHKVIGHVTKLVGTATAMRNGVSIILNNGDNVEKGDVVASGADSTLGITFIDGTVFGLSSNARMVLNEMVYDPNGSNNSSLLSLVAGTITFVAGETAKHGDMKIDTPVATMGIRGTAVLVEIDFSVPGAAPDAKFQVLVEPDGTTGSYILFDKTTLTPLAVVDRAGTQINISNGIMSQTLAPLSPEIQKLINDVFTLKFTDNSNTKSLDHFTDSIVPTDLFGPFKFAGLNNNAPQIPVIVNLVVAEANSSNNGISTKGHIPEAPVFHSDSVVAHVTERPDTTGSKSADTIGGQIQYFDVNTSDHDTVSVKFSSFTYQNAKGQNVSSSLNSLQLADIAKVEAKIGIVEPFNLDSDGNATATWTYSVQDHAFDFLAAGEKLTLTYTATVDNNYQPLDQSSSQTFTITITGTNDAPVITSSQQNINFIPAGTDTQGGELIPDTTKSGTLAFTDPDLTDTHTVAVKMASALLDGNDLSATVGQGVIDELGSALTAKITPADDSTGTGAGTIEWALADLKVYLADVVPAGETLVLTYAVTVTDSQGATSTQDIVVTIGGNQPAATVWIDTDPISPNNEGLWSTASNWESDRTPTSSDDVFIGTDQVLPSTPTFPVTVNADAQAKSLTMDYFTDFGTAIPELDVESNVTLTIADALKLDTSTDSSSPLTAESIIKNWGTISVGGVAELLKHSVLDNYGTFYLAQGGEFADQSSITNSGTIEVAHGTLDVTVDIVNSVTTTAGSGAEGVAANAATVTIDGKIQVDAGATLLLADGGGIIGGNLSIANGGLVEVTYGQHGTVSANGATLDGVDVTNDGTIQVDGAVAADPTTMPPTHATPAATLTLDDGTTIKGGDLTIADGATLDIEAGTTGAGATLDGVTVSGTNGDSASTIEVGTLGAATLLLDDNTTITNGNLTIGGGSTLDVEAGKTGHGATLDGVAVSGTSGDTHSTIEIGTLGAATLLLDDGTTVTNGHLTIAGGSTVDVEAGTTDPGATLDGVTVNGTNSTESSAASNIEIGASAAATLLLNDGTTITNGHLTIDDGSTVDVEAGTTGPGAALDGVTVSGTDGGNPSTIAIGEFGPATLLLDDGTTITNGNLTVAGGSTLDVEAGKTGPGATLDGVTVSGADATESVAASTIAVGNSGTATLQLDDGTTITNGNLTIAAGSTVDVESVNGATLNGVTVSGSSGDTHSTIEIGNSGAATLLLDDGTTITNGNLTIAGGSTLAVESGTGDPGATLDGVAVTGTSADSSSTIEIGTLGAATLLLDDGTTITNGNLAIVGGSTLDVEAGKTGPGATLDGVTVHGTNAIDLIAASTIEVGNSGAATLTLDDGTTITNGNLTIAGGSTLDVESSQGATLDGVNVTNSGTIQVDGAAESTTVTLVLDGGTKISGGQLLIHDLKGDDEGVVEIETGGATFDDVAVTNNNQLIIDPLVTLVLTDNTSITGGTITDNGAIDVAGNSSISGTVTVNPHGPPTVVDANLNNGQVTIESGVTLTLNNVLVDGTILTGVDSTSTIVVSSGTALGFDGATISGGTLDLVGGLNSTGNSFITGATIINAGNIDIVNGTLTIDPTPITNTGTIEVDANAGLVLDDEVITNSVTTKGHTTNGTVQVDHNGLLTFDGGEIDGGIVNNFGGTIDVTAASSINDTFSFVNFGTIEADGAALTLTNTTVNNFNGTFETLGANGILKLANTAINLGTLAGKIATSSGNVSSTLNGGFGLFSGLTLGLGTIVTAVVGVLELTGNIFNYGEIDANQGLGVAVNLDNVALYGGELGGLGTIVTAAGKFDSVMSGVTIADHATVTASAGQLELTGTISNGGEIDVTIPGKLVLDDATVIGGTLEGPGQISTAPFDFSGSTLEGVTIAHGTTVNVTDGTALELVGTIVDAGTIALNSFGDWTGLKISGNVSLTGGGDVVMGDSSHNFIVSDGSAATLTNYDTISGAGAIGDSHLTLVNFGTIDANGTNKLIIDTGANSVANNHGGVLEASPGSILQIDANVVNNGTIESGQSGAHSAAFVDISGNITGTGSIDIFANAQVEIGGTVSSGQTVTFEQSNGAGLLILDDSHDFKGTIAGLVEANPENAENHVDLKDLAFSDARHMSVSFSNSTHEVTITNTLTHDSVSLHVTTGSNFSNEFEIHSDGHGGTLLDDPSATGTNTIDSGDVLGISAASSATVTFTNTNGNTGELLLNDYKDFTGTVSGFTGDGTTANSDLIDISTLNFADVATNKTTYVENANGTGTLTLHDANGQVLDSINFTGDYQLANFTIENDGNGDTLIVDPPVNSGQTPSHTLMASNQNSSGTAATDGFVFNFAGFNHPPATDFHPDLDPPQPGGPALTNLHTGQNNAPEADHWKIAQGSDGHDHLGLGPLVKPHLHGSDFHIV